MRTVLRRVQFGPGGSQLYKFGDDEFHKYLLEANTKLIKNYFSKMATENIKQAEKLYLSRNNGYVKRIYC